MKYHCLIVDHDDTVVDSTATIHHPCFVEYMKRFPPHYRCSLEEYFAANFHGTLEFFRDVVGMTEAQMRHESAWWNEYVQSHVPSAYPGMAEILWEHRRRGGLLCVVSHSYSANILRDYRENALPEPDLVFGWEYPPELRKPSPWPLDQIMEKLSLMPDELLVLDDLKPGFEMARARGVRFAAAGWANDIPEIEDFMRAHCDDYFKTVPELRAFLFD